MNVWRWIGLTVFLIAITALISTTKLPVHAGGQDKDKKQDAGKKDESKKDEGKKDEGKKDSGKKDEGKKDEGKKDEGKKDEAKKDEGKKDEGKKPEVKTPPQTGGDKLEFKAFDKGAKPFYQEQFTKTTQTMKVMGQSVEQKQDQTFLILWTPQDPDKDGNYVVKQKIAGVKMNIDIGGNKISFDSTAKNPKNPMTDFFEALMKEELTFTIQKDLTVKDVGGRDKFVKNLVDINPQMQSLLKAILSDAALKKMAEPTWWAYPASGTVAKDQSWKKEATLDLGPIGNYKTEFNFTYQGQDKGMDKIGIKSSVTYSAPTDNKGLPFVITKAELSGKDGTGEATFDRAKGRFDETKIKTNLKGKLTIDVGNMTTDVEIDQVQEASSKIRDENTWDAAKK